MAQKRVTEVREGAGARRGGDARRRRRRRAVLPMAKQVLALALVLDPALPPPLPQDLRCGCWERVQ